MTSPKLADIEHHYAGVLLVTSSGRLIGQQRDDKPGIDNPGKIGTFGGTVEPGEHYRHAAWRELVSEETNLKIEENKLRLFLEDTAWRKLTKEWEARHFYYALISETDLNNLEVYEGQGWAEIKEVNDPRLIELWRPVVQRFIDFQTTMPKVDTTFRSFLRDTPLHHQIRKRLTSSCVFPASWNGVLIV